jgi:hypothetical protein
MAESTVRLLTSSSDLVFFPPVDRRWSISTGIEGLQRMLLAPLWLLGCFPLVISGQVYFENVEQTRTLCKSYGTFSDRDIQHSETTPPGAFQLCVD